MKKILACMLALMMAVSLCACGGGSTEKSYAGEYTAYAAESGGQCLKTEGLLTSVLTLKEDGTGTMTFNEETQELESYKVEGEKISLTAQGTSIEGTIKDGIIKIEDSDFTIYYVAEGADVSGIEVSDLSALFGGSEETTTEAVTEATTEAATQATTEAPKADASKKHYVVSDDTHFVIELSGVLLSYELDGDKVIGLKGYIDSGSEEIAKAALSQYEADSSITNVEVDGTWVIITYGESQYSTTTLKSLEAAFGDKKVTE